MLIDSGEEAAMVVDIRLYETQVRSKGDARRTEFFVTDDPERFARIGSGFFGRELCDVRRVDL